jgi:hypothetical protein
MSERRSAYVGSDANAFHDDERRDDMDGIDGSHDGDDLFDNHPFDDDDDDRDRPIPGIISLYERMRILQHYCSFT